ncbi:hypothetical protein CLG_A0043 (plasmid) [Clostridium botulinum D str. 1873]|uniref:Uncharacterized protein n=1 Tax=Clostridium botulinum D str. 1873 TaxID=592027 RepID=A0A9N7AZ38_CLOBO|nr:hypothetical protein CLG_A0043 [Clostridium botulinum D str. 1873]
MREHVFINLKCVLEKNFKYIKIKCFRGCRMVCFYKNHPTSFCVKNYFNLV